MAGGDVERGAGADADEGFTGMDAHDLVGGLEGHAAGLAGVHDDAAEASAPVGIKCRHLMGRGFRCHGSTDINLRTFPLKAGACRDWRAGR